MEFIKKRVGIILLILSLIVVLAAIWYLLFGMQNGIAYEGGTLVETMWHAQKMMCV
ncbi:MAG: hypothetical protein RR590_07890 [Hungatella sp.]